MLWPPYDAARRCGGILSFDISSCFFNILRPRLSCSHDPADVPPYAPKVRQERPQKLPEKEPVCLGAASPAPAILATDASMHHSFCGTGLLCSFLFFVQKICLPFLVLSRTAEAGGLSHGNEHSWGRGVK
ncbi:hypothetical protein TcG_06288 [Trypanosoma cruzi]|nr:hypothetical protein TcG_06288 [Trypanosoma cruzi]